MTRNASRWLLPQLERLGKIRPEALDRILARALEEEPDLERDLALLAAYHGDLTVDECAKVLDCSCTDIRAGLEGMPEGVEDSELVKLDSKGVARLGAPKVAVWEIVREFRKAGSVSELQVRFPRLSESEIRAALSYCGRNPDEIAAQISAYEEIAARAKAAYPFA